VPWAREDVIAVGFAGMVGIAATWFDSTLDREVRDRLKELKDTELVKGWDRDTHRMPIDYMGPGFGGPAHRVALPGTTWAGPSKRCARSETGNFAESSGQTASARMSAVTWANRLRDGTRR
jgi:hypothetical protein